MQKYLEIHTILGDTIVQYPKSRKYMTLLYIDAACYCNIKNSKEITQFFLILSTPNSYWTVELSQTVHWAGDSEVVTKSISQIATNNTFAIRMTLFLQINARFHRLHFISLSDNASCYLYLKLEPLPHSLHFSLFIFSWQKNTIVVSAL